RRRRLRVLPGAQLGARRPHLLFVLAAETQDERPHLADARDRRPRPAVTGSAGRRLSIVLMARKQADGPCEDCPATTRPDLHRPLLWHSGRARWRSRADQSHASTYPPSGRPLLPSPPTIPQHQTVVSRSRAQTDDWPAASAVAGCGRDAIFCGTRRASDFTCRMTSPLVPS